MPEGATIAKESHVDVLIIGAGPAGLMCANGLAKNGVNVRIVDKRPIKVAAGQADGIQPRTLEVLQSYGLAERLLKEANQMHMAAFYNPGPNGIERVNRAADISAPTPARYPFEATLHQGAIENIFLDSMRTMNVEVERPVVPISIELSTNQAELDDPESHPVKVELSHLDPEDFHEVESEVVHAKFVLGADGARSWVRKSLGITLDGESTEYIWGVLDIIPDTDFPDIRNRTAVHSENGSCMIIPREGDKVRLYLQLDDNADLIGEDGRLDRSAVTPARLMDVARKSFHPFRMEAVGEPEWWTLYLISQRVASKFSVNERVFIAGDACHTHSPKAGQGMNASMNDSHNLLWKLTHVLRGWSKMSVLKTYEAERRKYAQDLIAFDKTFSALFSTKAKSAENDAGISHDEFLQAFKTFGGFTSGIGIHYAPSAIVDPSHQACAAHLTVGQRVPPQILLRAADARPLELQDLLPADARYKLLVFAGDARDAGQLARVRAFADAVGADGAFAREVVGGAREKWLDVLTVCRTPLQDVDYTAVPPALRSHWSKVLVDDIDLTHTHGGKAYDTYGIGAEGAAVVVRPDGYVGIVAPLDKPAALDGYFRASGLMA